MLDRSTRYGRVFLRRNGSLAFAYGATLIGRDPTGRLAEYPVVRVATVTRGGERIAAESPDIVGGSLTLSRDRRSLKYIEAGRQRSVPFD